LTNSTLAPTTAPPLGSVTVPRIRPPVLCPDAPRTASAAHTTTKHKESRFLHKDVRNESFEFMDFTPEPRRLILHRDFEVAVHPKPYYNPVKLWNAGCDVKQKEFT
jgi:hypothetical protein